MSDKVKGEKTDADRSGMTAEEIKALVKEAVGSAVAVGMTVAREARADATQRVADSKASCSDCGQYRAACKGQHKMAVVYPKNPRLVRPGWVGVKLNGVPYKSNHKNHKICIPAKSPILAILAAWERAEENMSITHDLRQNIGNLSPLPGRSRISRF